MFNMLHVAVTSVISGGLLHMDKIILSARSICRAIACADDKKCGAKIYRKIVL